MIKLRGRRPAQRYCEQVNFIEQQPLWPTVRSDSQPKAVNLPNEPNFLILCQPSLTVTHRH
jgi:hypothetical protein